MDISVVIINYNTFELTSNCLRSIYRHTSEIEFEIVLVDNDSSECSPDLFLSEFPDIELVKSPINGGFAKGNNLGVERAKGRYIALLNSDTELLNNALKIVVDYFSTDSKNRCSYWSIDKPGQ